MRPRRPGVTGPSGSLRDRMRWSAYTWRARVRPPFRGFMAKEEPIQLEGQVTEVLPNATFRVQLTNGHNVLATLGGNMRRFRIRVLQGDRVTIEVSPYDLTRGRIIFRHKN